MRRSVTSRWHGDVETLKKIKQEVVCGKSHRVLHTQQLPQTGKADPVEQRGQVIEFDSLKKKSA